LGGRDEADGALDEEDECGEGAALYGMLYDPWLATKPGYDIAAGEEKRGKKRATKRTEGC